MPFSIQKLDFLVNYSSVKEYLMKVGIIGAGASGLALASLLEQLNIDYMLFNKGKVGRKILASGNGRCNISHNSYKSSDYFDNPLAIHILDHNFKDVFEFFNSIGIYTKTDNEGRMYPISESSQSVLNILLKNIHEKIIDIEIDSIKKSNDKYYLNGCYGPLDKIILATGSIASFKKPYLSLDYLKDLDIKFNPFVPSLVGFQTTKKIKAMSGARAKCHCTLIQNKNIIHEEDGEVIFKDNGISGIVIMNLSGYYQHLKSKADAVIKIDFSYNKDYPSYESIIQPKILDYLLLNNIDVHSLYIPILGVYDFEFAQVCKGGIDISMVNDNLSLKKDKNIFAMGEVLDVDAICGGYNLMFAFASAIQVFKEIKNEIQNK